MSGLPRGYGSAAEDAPDEPREITVRLEVSITVSVASLDDGDIRAAMRDAERDVAAALADMHPDIEAMAHDVVDL